MQRERQKTTGNNSPYVQNCVFACIFEHIWTEVEIGFESLCGAKQNDREKNAISNEIDRLFEFQVEDRKKAILDAERDRREYIVRKNQERDARLDTKRRNERSSIVRMATIYFVLLYLIPIMNISTHAVFNQSN